MYAFYVFTVQVLEINCKMVKSPDLAAIVARSRFLQQSFRLNRPGFHPRHNSMRYLQASFSLLLSIETTQV